MPTDITPGPIQETDRSCFLHVPKTDGLTLIKILDSYFAREPLAVWHDGRHLPALAEEPRVPRQVVSPGTTRSSLDPAWTGDEPGENQGQTDDTMRGAGRDTMTFIKTYENKSVATLKSDHGTTMLCRFNLGAGGAGMGGGTGECQSSKGAKITTS